MKDNNLFDSEISALYYYWKKQGVQRKKERKKERKIEKKIEIISLKGKFILSPQMKRQRHAWG